MASYLKNVMYLSCKHIACAKNCKAMKKLQWIPFHGASMHVSDQYFKGKAARIYSPIQFQACNSSDLIGLLVYTHDLRPNWVKAAKTVFSRNIGNGARSRIWNPSSYSVNLWPHLPASPLIILLNKNISISILKQKWTKYHMLHMEEFQR